MMFILVMMKMVITPERLHPLEWGIPGVNRVMHRTIHEISKNEAGEEHECVHAHDQVDDSKQC